MEKKDSIFAGLNPSPAPPASVHKTSEPPPARGRPENDAKVAALEVSIKALQTEIAALKQAVSRPPAPPPPPPAKTDPELLARIERSETGLIEIKKLLDSSKEDVATVNFKIADTITALEAAHHRLSAYTEEFSGIEQECRKSLGEMQGYLKNVSQKLVAQRLDDHLKDSVTRLSGRLSDIEKAMYASLGDLSSRLMSDEVLYGKIFSEAEERMRKGLAPDIQAINGQLKGIGEKVTWLMDEYNIVMERKIRVLDAKYSAFDALSARVEMLGEALSREKEAGK